MLWPSTPRSGGKSLLGPARPAGATSIAASTPTTASAVLGKADKGTEDITLRRALQRHEPLMLFHDRARIHVHAGRGGDGGLSFRREKHVPKGGPDGGDGGPGGDVVLVADPDLRDLSEFQRRQWFSAGKGGAGGGSGRDGAAG